MSSLMQHHHSIDDCTAINRIIGALQYYQTLDLINDKNSKHKLLRFCGETYKTLLDDYIHIVTEHNSNTDLDQILNKIIDDNGSEICNHADCQSFTRYYENHIDRPNHSNCTDDDQLLFYRNIMDVMHFYFLHSFDTASRVKVDDVKSIESTFGRTYDRTYDRTFDSTFTDICRIINEKKKSLSNYTQNTINNYSKFCTNYNQYNGGEQEALFMDGLYGFLRENNDITQNVVKQITRFFEEGEYDSDAVLNDIEYLLNDDRKNNHSSIIATFNMQCYHVIRNYASQLRSHEYSFSAGYSFYYWHYYRQHKMNQNHYWNENDRSEYGEELTAYIAKKYKSIKDEILNNNTYTLGLYQVNTSIHKALQYMTTDKARNCIAKIDDYLHYGIQKGSPLSMNHVLSVLLYCDWPELSKAFSSTFRKTNAYESILSVKTRNREFANMSRLIREAVEVYGSSLWNGHRGNSIGWSKNSNYAQGPFFHGMSFMMVLPEFSIRLCAPTSTSTAIEVATRFADDSGIIVQLNNTGFMNNNIRSFGCNWLSKYSSQQEWLFCGGNDMIRIESIKIMQTKQNFYPFFKAIFYFDSMINGTKINCSQAENIGDEDCLIINNLMKQKLKMDANTYDPYINSTFTLFTNQKTEIILDLTEIKSNFTKLSNLVISTDPMTIRPKFIQLFPNLRRITVHSGTIDLSALCRVPGFEIHSNNECDGQTIHCSINSDQTKTIGYNSQIMCEMDLIADTMTKEQYNDAAVNQQLSSPSRKLSIDITTSAANLYQSQNDQSFHPSIPKTLRADAAIFRPYVSKTPLASITEIDQIDDVSLNECDEKAYITKNDSNMNTMANAATTASKKRKKPKQSKQQRNNVPNYELITSIRARANVHISRRMTTQIIPSIIKENFSDLFFMMDIATALQFQDIYDNYKHTNLTFKILNYGFHDAINEDALYCIIKAQDISIKQNHGKKWLMVEHLFNESEIREQYGISSDQLPVSSHIHPRFSTQLQYAKNIQTILSDSTKTETFIKKTPWHKINIVKRSNPQRRLRLSLDKIEFIKQFGEFMKNCDHTKLNLIPILMFDNIDHWIEHILVIKIDTKFSNTNIGVSLKYEEENEVITATGIHLDKEFIKRQHISALPQHECKCLDHFESNINDINIGNPYENENKINALRQNYEGKINDSYKEKAQMKESMLEKDALIAQQQQLIDQLKEQLYNAQPISTTSSWPSHSNMILSSSTTDNINFNDR